MLSKGKGIIIGKLQTIITLIDADLQYMIRIFSNNGEEEQVETDKRFSKLNYSSRKNYSIESILLDKRLIFDNSLI